jgi:hypothetical protein
MGQRCAGPLRGATAASRERLRLAPPLRGIAACCAMGLACAALACADFGAGAGAAHVDEGAGRREDDGPALRPRSTGAGSGAGSGGGASEPSDGGGSSGFCLVCGEGASSIQCPCGTICRTYIASNSGGSGPGSDEPLRLPWCPPAPPFCDFNDHCAPGQRCEQGVCSCSFDSDCGPTSYACTAGKCAAFRCGSNLDCLDGLVCSVTGACESPLAAPAEPDLACAQGAPGGRAPWSSLAALALAAGLGRLRRRSLRRCSRRRAAGPRAARARTSARCR